MSAKKIPSLSAQEYLQRVGQGESMLLIDVRSYPEYLEGHIPTAKHLSLERLTGESLRDKLEQLQADSETPIVFTCHSGFRAQKAYQRMSDAGYRNLVLLDGGTGAWQKAGLPLTRRSSVISLERQIQIAIGGLLLLKVLFGFTVHELFFLAGAVIGAGLIIAGVTRWCGLARLIAAMPWNRQLGCDGKASA
ncbi:MAG: rhodanese-like domain-containing protein [Candidatus Thiodiazotropha sp.]